MSTNHIAIVSAIYEAFGRGDIPAITEHLAKNVQWESWRNNSTQKAGVPWMKKRTDKEGVLEFFKIVGGFEIQHFQVLSIMGGGNQVAAEFEIEFVYPATGAQVRDEEMHLWTFNDQGKIIRLRHYLDTAKHIAAAKGK